MNNNIIHAAVTIALASAQLRDAAVAGNTAYVSATLQQGFAVNTDLGPDDGTLLLLAVKHGHRDLVECLISNGADLDHLSSMGATPLLMATSRGNIDMVELLISSGANVDAGDGGGYNALITNANIGSQEMAELLIRRGANVNAITRDNMTALLMATYSNHKEMVKLLLSHNADVSMICDNKTALMLAQEKGYTEIAELLMSPTPNIMLPVSAFGLFGGRQSPTSITTELLSQRVQGEGLPGLRDAAVAGNTKYVSIALQQGFAVNTDLGIYDGTLLLIAVKHGHTKLVELLLARNADVNVICNNKTALMLAQEKGHTEIANLLMSANHEASIAPSAPTV